MPRSTSGLFVACAENVLLGVFLYTLLSGVMDLVMPADFSPAMRGVMLSQLVLAVVTGALILGLAVWDRTRLLVSPEAVPAGEGPVEQWARQRLLKCRLVMAICNAFCVCSLGLFVLFLAGFVQAVTGLGLDGTEQLRVRLASGDAYTSTQRLDWVQAVGGGSGWLRKGNATFAQPAPAALPVAGSVFAGVVLAFLLVSFLLALYLSLTAMPEGESSYLVLEPRGLVVTNGVVAFASTQGVGQHFAQCVPSGGGIVLFLLFCLLACWLHELPALVGRVRPVPALKQPVPVPGGPLVAGKIVSCILLAAVATSPVYMVYALQDSGGVPGAVMIFCGVVAAASVVMGVLEIVLFAGRESTLEKGLALLQAQGATEPAPPPGAAMQQPPEAPEAKPTVMNMGARFAGNRPRKQQAQEVPCRQPPGRPSLFLLHDPHELGYLPVASTSQLEQKWHVA